MIRPDPSKLAWAAGVLDTNGCVMSLLKREKKPYWRIAVTLALKDADVLHRFVAAIGIGVAVRGPQVIRAGSDARRYDVSFEGHERVQAVTAMLWPYLGERRRDELTKALAVQRAHGAGKPATSRRQLPLLTPAQKEELRERYRRATIGRQRVPKGWFHRQAAVLNVPVDMLYWLCQGHGSVFRAKGEP